MFLPEATRIWRECYSIDFDVLNTLPVDYGARGLRRPDHASWPVLGAPVQLASAEFAGSGNTELETRTLATLTGSGELNAFMLFFESHLADAVSLSTDPRLPAAEHPASWHSPVWLVPPIGVRPGEQVRMAFSWRGRGGHRWEVGGAAGSGPTASLIARMFQAESARLSHRVRRCPSWRAIRRNGRNTQSNGSNHRGSGIARRSPMLGASSIVRQRRRTAVTDASVSHP